MSKFSSAAASSMIALLASDPAIAPFLRAFALGFATQTFPQLIKILLQPFFQRRRSPIGRTTSFSVVLLQLLRAIAAGCRVRGGLAVSAGVAMGGAKALEDRLVRPALQRLRNELARRERVQKGKGRARAALSLDEARDDDDGNGAEKDQESVGWNAAATFIASTLSSLLAISLLSSYSSSSSVASSSSIASLHRSTETLELEPTFLTSPYPTISLVDDGLPVTEAARPSSKTLDLTLFFLVRALDTIIRGAYRSKGGSSPLLSFAARQSDTLLFVASCSRIMWCWFYLPELLPASYNKWIAKLSRMDPRLLSLLRHVRSGDFVYGVHPSTAIANEMKMIPVAMQLHPLLANPFYVSRLDCVMVHGRTGATTSCEVNAVKRFVLAFFDALAIYLPVHLIPVVLFSFRSFLTSPLPTLLRVLLGAGRSSAFLATFIASLYASVCLVRTRLPAAMSILGIHLDQNRLDGGLCAQAGVIVCGFSILIENKRRRREMSLYVAPRAIYTLMDMMAFPHGKSGELIARWVERSIFALSSAVVTTATIYRPELVSGVVRGVMFKAMGDWKQVS